MTQHQQVINVMASNGGFATLGFLNHKVDVSSWRSKTPYASIRRIVQDTRFFFKIKPGLWALKSMQDEVLSKLQLTTITKAESEEFNHTYYQGLIAEIGNYNSHLTFVPNQDKNRTFLDKPLKEVTTVGDILEFTYPEVVKRAKTIDVIWFNQRHFPSAFFEVEHSTDFQNSFAKFVDLQDFYADFVIVSSDNRKKEFEHKISFNAFNDIKSRVVFMDYNELSILHTQTFEYHKLSKKSPLKSINPQLQSRAGTI